MEGSLVEVGRPPADSPEHLATVYEAHAMAGRRAQPKAKMGRPPYLDYLCEDRQPDTNRGADLEKGSSGRTSRNCWILIGQPVILLLHSGRWRLPAGMAGGRLAPSSSKGHRRSRTGSPPPIEEAEKGEIGCGDVLWGLTNLPVHYDPPIKESV